MISINLLRKALLIAAALTVFPCLIVNAQVRFASPGDSLDDVKLSVDSVASFVRVRSGLEFSDLTRARLADLEQRTLTGANRRLNANEVVDVLTDAALSRLQSLTDQEIEQATVIYGRSHELDGSYAGFTWGEIKVSPAEFANRLRRFREDSRKNGKELRKKLRLFMAGTSPESGVNGHLELYRRVLPDQFGAVFQTGITPLQTVLLTYAMLSDDPIHLSGEALTKELKHAREWIGGDRYAPEKVRYPFGANGYLFAAPVNLFLDEKTISDLLQLIQKRTQT